MVENILKCLQALVLLTVLLIVIGLVVFTDYFAQQTQRVFAKLSEYDLGLELGTKGLTLTYTAKDAVEAISEQAKLDELRMIGPCLIEGSCKAEEMIEIASVIDFQQSQAQVQQESKWIVVFAASEDPTEQVGERFILARAGYDVNRLRKDNVFRFFIAYSDRQTAESELPKIQSLAGRTDSFIRALDEWCPDRTFIDTQPSYLQCSDD